MTCMFVQCCYQQLQLPKVKLSYKKLYHRLIILIILQSLALLVLAAIFSAPTLFDICHTVFSSLCKL